MQKKIQKIRQRIAAIESGIFDEDDIKLLLIEIREKLKGESFLKEICDFVAHSDRNKGICHKKVNVRYAKLKLAEDNFKRILTSDFIEKNRNLSERLFSDKVLSYIQNEKIQKDLFELLILSGIDDIEDELFLKYYKLNKSQVVRLIKKSYKLDKSFYIQKNILTQTGLVILDDLLKFIRGTVTGKPAFSEQEIIDDFILGLKRLSAELNYKPDFDKIKMNKSDLIVCIISLLHDSTFKLFDGATGIGFISLHPQDNEPEICLMSDAGNFIVPLITTNVKASDYIDCKNDQLREYEFKKIPWTNCLRNEQNIMKLMKCEAAVRCSNL